MKDIEGLNFGPRKEIFNFILDYPGLHLRELSRKLKIPVSTLNYHLRNLEKSGLIKINKEKRYDRVYANEEIGNMAKKLINAIRQETSCKIVLFLSVSLIASQKDLSTELEISSTTIGKHLKRLEKMGIIEPAPIENGTTCTAHLDKTIIERTPDGREVLYRLTRPTSVNMHMGPLLYKLLMRYKKGLSNNDIKIFLEYLDTVLPEKKRAKRYKKTEKYIDQFEKNLFEIFPHPYHI